MERPGKLWGLAHGVSHRTQWLTGQKPQYTFQVKLTIPLSAGIDLPIVYRYANRTALLNQTGAEARLGLCDFASDLSFPASIDVLC